jgi:predicted nucleic acid-binding protein
MNALVIDTSATLGFLLKDEQDDLSRLALATIRQGVPTFAPAHWPVEVANALLVNERQKRVSQAEVIDILHLVQKLPITIDEETAQHTTGDTYALARQFSLTIYDAAYLELAMRRGATLATSDRELVKAAKAAGVSVLQG